MLHKRKWMLLLLVLAAVGLLLLASGCKKKPGVECKKDIDCTENEFKGVCEKKRCVYEPIPDKCGNRKSPDPDQDFGQAMCERDAGENECTCPADCGECEGRAKGSAILEKTCNAQNECITTIDPKKQKRTSQFQEVKSKGDTFRVTLEYPTPFNFGADAMRVTIGLVEASKTNSNRRIKRIDLSGVTKDRRTLRLVTREFNLPVWAVGSEWEISEDLVLDAPPDTAGQFTELKLVIDYEYVVEIRGTASEKPGKLSARFKEKMEWAVGAPGDCPEAGCPQEAGRSVECGPQTSGRCIYTFKTNTCGNYACEPGENRCSCASDCGPCAGGTTHLTFGCAGVPEQCLAQLKPGITIEDKTIFDDRDIGKFHLQNNFKYRVPFNVKQDKLVIDFTLYEMSEGLLNVIIEAVRVLERGEELAGVQANALLPRVGKTATVELELPPQSKPELERTLSITVWYKYTDAKGETTSTFTKSLGKVVLLTPG